MRRQLLPALRLLAVLTVVLGVLYPLAITGVGQALFSHQADGSIITVDGEAVGSSLVGQVFTGDEYFESRPSAAGDGYDATASAASNLGPNNPDLLATVEERAVGYRERNGLAADAEVPVDAVTASASGLDPHVSVANARLQAERVAAVRDVPVEDVLALVDEHTDGRTLGFLGEAGVNVLELNLALDKASAS